MKEHLTSEQFNILKTRSPKNNKTKLFSRVSKLTFRGKNNLLAKKINDEIKK